MNLKKFLTCAVAVSMLVGVPNISYAEDTSDNIIENDSIEVIEIKNDSDENVVNNSTINRTERRLARRNQKPETGYQRARFVKLTMDDNYTYYLDRESVKWVRVPYTSSEYMADVWIRMIERFPEDDPDTVLREYEYFDPENQIGEVMLAQSKGVRYDPTDIEVLRRKEYFLEHYYIRPKTKQIQFLCELEVVGHPQNNAEGREYSHRNWEYLIPGSVESMLYKAVLKEIGTSMADAEGHRTFADYFEEYTRISIR